MTAVAPPEMVESLVRLKYDAGDRTVGLDQDALQSMFRRYTDYIRDLNNYNVRAVQEEIANALTNLKNECSAEIVEKGHKLEEHLTAKFESLDKDTVAVDLMKLQEKVSKLVREHNETSRLAGAASKTAETALQRAMDVGASQAEMMTGKEARPRPESRSPEGVDDGGGGGAGIDPQLLMKLMALPQQVKDLQERFGGGQTTGAAGESEGGGGGGGVSAGDMSRFASKEDLTNVSYRLKDLANEIGSTSHAASMHGNEIVVLKKEAEATKAALTASRESINKLGYRIDKTNEDLVKCGGLIGKLRSDHDALSSRAAEKSAVDTCMADVKEVKLLCSRELAKVQKGADARFEKADRTFKDVREEVALAAKGRRDIAEQMEAMKDDHSSAEENQTEQRNQLQQSVDERFGKTNAWETEAQGHVTRLQTNVTKLWESVITLGGKAESKADQEEVHNLRTALSMVSDELKGKEQAVLFGARCLSCNRTFDDVQQESGVVDVRAEKNKAKVFAEINRAMHNPNSDPGKPVKLLAVKVGRPGSVISPGTPGVFQSREALNFACGVQDVQIMPMPWGSEQHKRLGAATTGVPETPTRPTTTKSELSPLSPPKSARATRRMAGSSCGVDTFSRREADHQRSHIDFKHPISSLLGSARM